MKAREKLAKVKRFYARLRDENRSIESYKDDLYACFIECWSVQDWLKKDKELIKIHPDIGKRVNKHVNSNEFIKIAFDIANREKHLVLQKSRADGEIAQSKIGIGYSESIKVSPELKVDFIHIDQLKEYDAKKAKEKEMASKDNETVGSGENHQQSPTTITQDYIVTSGTGETYSAMFVIEKTIEAWESFIDSL